MLGIIHNLFTPKPYKIKDYIALPKANGYQSLHTAVFGLHGLPTEFQIRTLSMHLEAEYGIAAHYFYSYGHDKDLSIAHKSKKQWATKILELKKQFSDPHSKIIEQLKFDIFQDRIFVFTPNGDVIDLPKNATCIDLAYAIHSAIGDHAEKAEINDFEVNINTTLKSGDTVKIITNKENHPSSTWLDYTQTSLAKRKIKEAINQESKEKQILMGKERFQKELYLSKGLNLASISSSTFKKFLNSSPYSSLEDLYIAIGEGKLNPNEVIDQINKSKIHEYNVKFKIIIDNSVGVCIDCLKIFKELDINITKILGTESLLQKSEAEIKIYAKIQDIKQIRQIMESIANVPMVRRIERMTPYRSVLLILGFILIFSLLAIHPFVIKYVITYVTPNHPFFYIILPYTSLVIIYIFTLVNERLFSITLAEKNKMGQIWLASLIMSVLGLIVAIAEIIIFKLQIFTILFLLGIVLLYSRLYFIYSKEKDRIKKL